MPGKQKARITVYQETERTRVPELLMAWCSLSDYLIAPSARFNQEGFDDAQDHLF